MRVSRDNFQLYVPVNRYKKYLILDSTLGQEFTTISVMPQVIFLSDSVTPFLHGMSRYIGPYALASQLNEAGFKSIVIDYMTQIPDLFSFLENFLSPETLVIGLSSTFLSQPFSPQTIRTGDDVFQNYQGSHLHCADSSDLVDWFAQLRKRIRARAPKCKIVLGGAKALDLALQRDFSIDVDYVCVGAGDEAIVEAVRALSEDREPNFVLRGRYKILAGVTLKNQRQICPDSRFSVKYGIQQRESLPIEVSRGCIFNCKFCYYEKKESIRKDLDLLRGELIRNYENFGTTVYHLTDDCFNDHRDKVEAICNMFLSLPFKIEWVTYARVDVAVRFPETLDLMIKSGARGLFWGIESFHETAVKRVGKGTPVDKVKKMLLEFQSRYKGQCISYGSFIVGLPGEPEESILQTRDWLCENSALDAIGVSPLQVGPYSANLDQKVVDYADFSRHPEKYGFKVISFKPRYWEHETMNSDEASSIAHELMDQWNTQKGAGPSNYVWTYPHLRTLGFNHDEIMRQLRRSPDSEAFSQEAALRFRKFTAAVHRDTLSAVNR